MTRRYEAFLVRHWTLGEERGNRVEVVHIQSGDRALGTSPAQAVAWMQARATSGETVDRASLASRAAGESGPPTQP